MLERLDAERGSASSISTATRSPTSIRSTPSTQFTRAGIATEGESRYSHVWSHQAQLSDTLTWTRGRHYLKAGGSLARATSGGDGTEFGGAFVLGQFTINPTATARFTQLTIADASRYTQTFNFGVNDYTNKQWIYALFAQDSFRVRSDLTLDLGLRYDRQTFTDGNERTSRLGSAPGGIRGATRTPSIRGGYALYYTMIRANTDASFTLGGPEGQFDLLRRPGPGGLSGVAHAQSRSRFPAGACCRRATSRSARAVAITIAQFFDISRLPTIPTRS